MQWTLSQETKLLIESLHRPVSFWQSASQHKVDKLRLIVECGNPAAIPDLAHLVLHEKLRVSQAAARSISSLMQILRPSEFAWLDQLMRERSPYRWVYPNPWTELKPGQLGRLQMFGADSLFILGLASFHFSGYVRQAALLQLAETRSGPELTFILLRLNDWVKPVRDTAKDLLQSRLTPEYAPHFVPNMVLVDRLRFGGRGHHQEVLVAIENSLKSDQGRRALEEGLGSQETSVKRLCYKVAFETNSLDPENLIQKALTDRDPTVKLQGINRLPTLSNRSLTSRLLASAMEDRFAPVRRKALEISLQGFSQEAPAWLESALLDAHPAVRGYAQFQITAKGFDLERFYEAALSKAEGVALYAAISGLGETGKPTAANRVIQYVSNPVPRLRRAAIRTLARLNVTGFLRIFLDGLCDESPRVSREAAKALTKVLHLISGQQIWAIFKDSLHPHVRRACLFLIARLSKWESVAYLVEASADGENEKELARTYLRRWYARFNLSFTDPSNDQIARLRAALAKSRIELEPSILRYLRLGTD